ncbi:MAG: ribonuclease Z [Oscillibacter sp.]|nr:ribonuclease Z [Oscillibacter sp.]
MILVACIDDRGGMLFNHRRQSQDRLLRLDLLREAGGRAVWMNEYSRKQFSEAPENLRVAEDFYLRAAEGEFCFFENVDPVPYLDRAEMILLYHWNRRYPSDPPGFPQPLVGWSVTRREDFVGASHACITKEILV